MSKALLIAAALLSLASCMSAEEVEAERVAVEVRLPPGCEFYDAGDYLGDDIYVVTCDGRQTQTAIRKECHMVGKVMTCSEDATVTIQ